MVSVTMATSEWIQFFRDAGIPPGPAVNYAVTFVDNRIQKTMLLDLTKELMKELGITVVGDVIAILKHAKVVYRQEMCKAATQSLCPSPTALPAEPRRNPKSAAGRMIANSLSRDPPPAAPPPPRTPPPRPPASKISVTVPNKPPGLKAGVKEEKPPPPPVKRRRVTAEMEGKYIVHMPRGTTPRSKKILEQQAAKAAGLQRTSVFERLGAEAGAEPPAGGKPTGVFSRLGDALGSDKATESDEEEEEEEEEDDDDDCSVLQYAGVLKKLPKPPRKESAARGGGTPPARSGVWESKALAGGRRKIAGIGKKPQSGGFGATSGEAEESVVSSSKERKEGEFGVTIKRTWGCGKVSSTSDGPAARMDLAGSVSVFQRLGRKMD